MTRLIPAAARPSIVTASDAAAAVGVSRATLYRWGKLSRRNRLEPRSCRPHSPRGPAWSADLVSAVRELRAHYPMEGKTRIAVLPRREGHAGSESTVGHIRKRLVAQGACPRDAKPQGPGETVQRDTLTIPFRPGTPRRQAVHRLRSPRQVDMRQAWRRANAHNAKRFLDKLQADLPFPVCPSRSIAAPSSGPTSSANAATAASPSSNARHDPPNSTVMSNATTAHGATSSMPHGTCPITPSTTSTDGSTPSPTSSIPSDRPKPSTGKPTTFNR